ncbi:MAG: hypothetical protein MK212_22055, partial [Saprospiraceae bacterium]|nr:hypothetical protein [Saprospiraceae bacterium]
MKLTNKHIYIIVLALWLLSSSITYAQTQRLSKATSRALNNYIQYSNEVVYAVNIMYADFIELNMQFDDFVEGRADRIVYTKQNVLTNYDYFPVYPRELFNEIYNDNIYIPYKERGEPLKQVSKIVGVLDEIEAARATLNKYILSEEYRKDSILAKGYKVLRRVEVLYYDMFTLQEKLHWSLRTIIGQYVHPQIDSVFLNLIRELQPLISQSKIVIKAIRSKDTSSSLSYNRAKLAELIRALETKKEKLFSGIESDPKSLKSPQRRFDNILKKSKNILGVAQQYISSPKYQGLLHEPSYYYYNAALLPEYNRYGDGMVTLFNKMIDNSSIYWLRDHEMPFLFEVIYPDVPAYADEKIDSLPDAEDLIKKLMLERAKEDSLMKLRLDSIAKAKQDSLRADSIAQAKKNNPEVGDPSLNGFATNNLIFVLDISSSMNEADKLPLLKEAM